MLFYKPSIFSMYTGMYIVLLFILFINIKEQLQSCKASDIKVADKFEKEKSCQEELNGVISKMLDWKQKFEAKLAIIEGDIHGIKFNLISNIENERKLKIELLHLYKQQLESSNFNRIMIYDLLCLMGK